MFNYFLKKSPKYFVIFLLLLSSSINLHSTSLNSAYKSLEVFDYFKAKQLFYKLNKKHINSYAAYGLATIYFRNDNPFFNLDSASKFINLSYTTYIFKQKPKLLFNYKIDSLEILKLIDSVANKSLDNVKKTNTVVTYNKFLKQNYLANYFILNKAIYFRDELEFNLVLSKNLSQATQTFINTHPQSEFTNEAFLLLDQQIYNETTKNEKPDEYIYFLEKYPKNSMQQSAYEKLFQIYKNQSSKTGLTYFVNKYPNAPQNMEAWKLLFSLSVKAFTNSELKVFLINHPNCPLKNSLLSDLELNKIQLFSFQKNDYFGFIDTSATISIPAIYDALTPFVEGLSVVTKNDSVFFINKNNKNVFNQFFTEAFTFNNGIAPVKQNNKWLFINRQGQIISETFDEINELSNNYYVFKKQNNLPFASV